MGYRTGPTYWFTPCPGCDEKYFIPLSCYQIGGQATTVCECGVRITIQMFEEGADIVSVEPCGEGPDD